MKDYLVIIKLNNGRTIELKKDDFPAKVTVIEKVSREEIKRRNFDVRPDRKKKDVIIHIT